jgi:hypothetical protein
VKACYEEQPQEYSSVLLIAPPPSTELVELDSLVELKPSEEVIGEAWNEYFNVYKGTKTPRVRLLQTEKHYPVLAANLYLLFFTILSAMGYQLNFFGAHSALVSLLLLSHAYLIYLVVVFQANELIGWLSRLRSK